MLNITKTLNGSELKIEVEGRLDTATASQLEKEVKGAANECETLVFDFAKLDYISSAGLRVLLSANKQMTQSGKAPVTVKNSNEIVREVFEVTGFTDILNIE